MSRRRAALDQGYMTYEAERACACGAKERYAVNGNCVNCHSPNYPGKVSRRTGDRELRAQNAEALKEAESRGLRMYRRVSPCQRCIDECGDYNSLLRYTTNGGCVACQKRQAKKQRELRKARFCKAEALVVPGHSDCEHGNLLIQFMPELKGMTLVYADFDHPWPRSTEAHNPQDQLVNYAPHMGKCICCHPDRAIGMLGALAHNYHKFNGQLDPDSEKLLMTLRRANSVNEFFPHGFLQWCMGQQVMRKSGPVTPVNVAEDAFYYRSDKKAPVKEDNLPSVSDHRVPANLFEGAQKPTPISAEKLAELNRLSQARFAQTPLPLPGKGNNS